MCRNRAGFMVAFAVLLGACATGGAHPGALGDAPPSAAARWRAAAWDAARDPATWAPAAAAVVLAGTADRPVADWASRNTPLFGTRAERISDHLRTASDITMIATALAVDDSAGGWRAKAERLLVEGAGAIGSGTATWILKGATHRERPDSSNARSFPSGHTSSAFASRVASLENLDDMALPRALDLGLRATVTGLAAATGWARVEAGVHYPSDVLAGAALGNFVERLVLGGVSGPGRPASVHARVGRSGVAVALRFEGGLRLSP